MGYEDLGAPQSRNEVLLMNMLGATYEVVEPQSRIEYLLKEILENGGTGGGDVTGVKGGLETEYRKGLVNLLITNIAELGNGLTYDSLTKTIKGNQYDVIPTPASVFEGKVIQYVGATSGAAKLGHFYQCVNDSGTYKWNDLTEEPESLTQEQINQLLALLD